MDELLCMKYNNHVTNYQSIYTEQKSFEKYGKQKGFFCTLTLGCFYICRSAILEQGHHIFGNRS